MCVLWDSVTAGFPLGSRGLFDMGEGILNSKFKWVGGEK